MNVPQYVNNAKTHKTIDEMEIKLPFYLVPPLTSKYNIGYIGR